MSEFWADIDDAKCPCRATGWAFVIDNHQECPIHFSGQLHPLTRDLLLDDPISLKEEERKSHLKWRIGIRQDEVIELQRRALKLQLEIRSLELELINKTPTIKMQAVIVDE